MSNVGFKIPLNNNLADCLTKSQGGTVANLTIDNSNGSNRKLSIIPWDDGTHLRSLIGNESNYSDLVIENDNIAFYKVVNGATENSYQIAKAADINTINEKLTGVVGNLPLQNANVLGVSVEMSGKTYFFDKNTLTPNIENLPNGVTKGFVSYYNYMEDENNWNVYVKIYDSINYNTYISSCMDVNGTIIGWSGWQRIVTDSI